MASGHVNRINRPNTWLHRPSLRREDSSCQPGAVHTWHIASVIAAQRHVRSWGLNGLHHRRSRSDASGLRPTFIPDSIRVPERVAVHVIDHRGRHRARGAQGSNQHPSYWLSTIQRVLQESLCQNRQNQNAHQNLPRRLTPSRSP